mmetsp:Transcript_34845/g.68796  ORF Transcript_34845/g.68796 Transcript_34845/m.68796 type:complete len:188 (+) Transcript_34845:421-984(+)
MGQRERYSLCLQVLSFWLSVEFPQERWIEEWLKLLRRSRSIVSSFLHSFLSDFFYFSKQFSGSRSLSSCHILFYFIPFSFLFYVFSSCLSLSACLSAASKAVKMEQLGCTLTECIHGLFLSFFLLRSVSQSASLYVSFFHSNKVGFLLIDVCMCNIRYSSSWSSCVSASLVFEALNLLRRPCVSSSV